MATKEKQECRVCLKVTNKECSHIECPNRRPLTADFSDNHAYLVSSDTSTWIKAPTNKE